MANLEMPHRTFLKGETALTFDLLICIYFQDTKSASAASQAHVCVSSDLITIKKLTTIGFSALGDPCFNPKLIQEKNPDSEKYLFAPFLSDLRIGTYQSYWNICGKSKNDGVNSQVPEGAALDISIVWVKEKSVFIQFGEAYCVLLMAKNASTDCLTLTGAPGGILPAVPLHR